MGTLPIYVGRTLCCVTAYGRQADLTATRNMAREKQVHPQQKNSKTDEPVTLTRFESRYQPGMTWRDLVQVWCPGADRRMADRILLRGTRWPFSQSLPVIEGQLAAVAQSDWRRRFGGD